MTTKLGWDVDRAALPQGWAVVALGDICDIVSGSTPPTKEPANWDGDIVWVTPDDQDQGRRFRLTSGRRSITQTGYDSCSTTMVPSGSVLMSSRAPIGYVSIADVPLCTNQGFKTFVLPEGLSPEYVAWYLRSVRWRIEQLGSGTTFKELSKRAAATIPLVVPPQREQDRIVEALERAHSHVLAAKGLLSAIPRRIEHLEHAALSRICDAPGAPRKKLGDVADVISGPAFKSKDFLPAGSGWRLLRGQNIAPGRLKWDEGLRKDYDPADARKKFHLQAEDLILAMDRPLISSGLKLAEVTADDLPAILAQRVARLRIAESTLRNWVRLNLSTPRFLQHLLGDTTGTQLPHITLEGIRSFEIAVPSDDELQSLADRASVVVSHTRRLQRVVETQTGKIPALESALLSRAFSGALTSRDPSDEPADQLLKRIAAAREQEKKTKQNRKST